MQEGIGRGGYRVLAIVGFAVGVLGLAMAAVSLDPSGFFEWLGFVLAALCLAALAGIVLATLGTLPTAASRPLAQVPAGAPEAPADLSLPEAGTEADPSIDLGFEYSEPEDMAPLEAVSDVPPQRTRPLGPPPRAMTPPAPVSAPPAGRARRGKDSGWPDRLPKAGVTRRQLHEENLPRDPGPDIEVDGPAPARRDPPIVMARTVASAEATGIPDGSGVGKCGNCGVLLLAPKKRPLRLQCPRCERVHTLA